MKKNKQKNKKNQRTKKERMVSIEDHFSRIANKNII